MRALRTALLVVVFLSSSARAGEPPAAPAGAPKTTSELLLASAPGDWRTPDPENLLYMDLAGGRVIFELAPAFAPKHVANVKAMVREKFFDGLSFMRSHDNYVVQFGDAEGTRPLKGAKKNLPAEFSRAIGKDLSFFPLPDADVYAPEVGFAGGFPAARDSKAGQAWLTHCYAMLGAGRDDAPDSGGGTELYVVIGHAPRHLDKNVTLLGRVLTGMELLSVLPRGTGALGFYEKPEQRVPIKSIRVAADVPAGERKPLEVLRTDTPLFSALIESRQQRRESWFKFSPGHVELCNVPLPVREAAAKK